MGNNYWQLAEIWAARYGIVEYKVKGRYMIYNVSFPATMFEPHYTMQRKIDLDKFETIENKRLKRYDPKGECNR